MNKNAVSLKCKMHLEDKKKKSFRRWKWSHVATFPEYRVNVVGMLRGTWSTPLTQFIARNETKSRISLRLKGQNTCPFAFAATAAPSPGFSTAASSFPAVLETFPPMLLVQQRNPTDQMIEQRPQASSQKFQAKGSASLTNRNRGPSKKNRTNRKETRGNSQNVAKVQKKRNFFQKIVPLSSRVWKWRNWPRRKWDAEYNAQVLWWMGTRAMTTQPRRLHQSQVPIPTSREEEEEGGHGVGGERGLWTMGDTTTTRHNFFWGFHLSQLKPGFTDVDCWRCYVSETPTEQTKHDKHKVT